MELVHCPRPPGEGTAWVALAESMKHMAVLKTAEPIFGVERGVLNLRGRRAVISFVGTGQGTGKRECV